MLRHVLQTNSYRKIKNKQTSPLSIALTCIGVKKTQSKLRRRVERMNMLKKLGLSSVMLFAVIMVVSVMTALADGEQAVKSETQVVADLGILVGDGNGLTDEYLNKGTTRIQAAIMFLRLKGLEADAKAFKGTDNFSDAKLVWAEGQSILAYLKANPQLGWQGMGNGTFDPLSGITAQQYYKVMLEALGFMQGMDFEYADVFMVAADNGLTKVATVEMFKNINVATATVEALNATMHEGGKTLAAALSDAKIIDASKLDALKYAKLELMQSATIGNYFVDEKGMALYYFTKDAADVNSCVGGCLAAWPIYYAEKLLVPAELNAADFGSFTRADGKMQSTYKGWPLYNFAKDTKAGDTLGDGVGKVWYVIQSPSTLAIGTSATLGNYLTDAKGMSLYYFDKDTKDVSNCAGPCLVKWPLFYAEHISVPAGLKAEDFGTITRADGAEQTTFKGFPLYYWASDVKRGDTLGQDVGKLWFVVDPVKFSGTTAIPPVPTTISISTSATLGNYLTDAKGMSLYYFDKDTKNVSNCAEACLAKWPLFFADPVTVPAGLKAEDFGTITRADGAKQTTFKGFPLYYWVNDVKSGDTLGQNVGKVWFVVDPVKFNGTTAVAPTEPPVGKTYNIDISNFAFSEAVLTIEVGSTVTWTNKDEVEHNAVAVDGTFKLPLLAQGKSGSFTFTKAGEYDYFCAPHKAHMTAKIIVK
jgi:predicted lipoprotein with Yx(FWY)xxD motif/plastocyanin